MEFGKFRKGCEIHLTLGLVGLNHAPLEYIHGPSPWYYFGIGIAIGFSIECTLLRASVKFSTGLIHAIS